MLNDNDQDDLDGATLAADEAPRQDRPREAVRPARKPIGDQSVREVLQDTGSVKENRRLIALLVSICLVCVLVLGLALWFFYPRDNADRSGSGFVNTSSNANANTQNPGTGSNAATNPGTSTNPSDPNSIGVVPSTQTQTTPSNAALATNLAGQTQTQASPGGNTQSQHQEINIYGAETPSYIVKDGKLVPAHPASELGGQTTTNPATTTTKPDTSAPANTATTGQTKPATVGNANALTSPAASSSSTRPSTSSSRTNSTAAPGATAGNAHSNAQTTRPSQSNPAPATYWIQVFASNSRDKVDQVRRDIARLGFNGAISTYNKDGKDYYRLRFGPYANKKEAEKFLEWARAMRGFETSYLVP